MVAPRIPPIHCLTSFEALARILPAERPLLNLLQRACGIATCEDATVRE